MKIIAHRGASAEAPENTLAAFSRAVEIGVEAIEADLLFTKDRRMVVRHDDLIQQGGTWHRIDELTFDELQRIDVGVGERIPSVEQLLDRFHGRCPIVLDLKTFGMAKPLADLLRRRGVKREVHVTSFLHAEVAEAGRLYPEVERSIALAAVPVTFEHLLRDTNTRHVSLYRGYINEAIAQQMRSLEVRVWVYSVELPREAEQFAAWGMDGILTGDPAAMQPLRHRG